MARKRKKVEPVGDYAMTQPEPPLTTLSTALTELAEERPAFKDIDNPNRVKSWAESVRPWQGPGDTGLKVVTTTSPDMIGIQFPETARATTDEKLQMLDDAGLRYFKEARAYLAPIDRQNRKAQHDNIEAVYDAIVEARRAEKGAER